MSHVVSSSAPITSSHTVKQYAGFGILGADIPTTGDNGGSPVLNDGINSAKEYHWRVETPPSAGVLTIYPDLTFEWDGSGVPDGSYPWVYRLFEDGVSVGTATVSQTVGSVTAQYVRPVSDISAGTWTASSGSDLFSMLDETAADDADYIITTNVSTCEVALGAFSDPGVNTGHIFRYKISASGGGMVVRIRQSGTTIASWTHSPAPTSPTLFTQTLSGAEADSITYPASLSIQFEAT